MTVIPASTADANLKVSDNAAVVLSDCLDGLLRTLIEKMVLASKHRNGLYRTMLEEDTARDVQSGNTAVEFVYVKTGDVKADIEARRNKERNKELEERRKVAELRNEEGGEDGVDMTKKAKKKLSARQLEASLPEEVKAANTRTAIDKSIGKTKTYSWLEGGGTKSEPLVPAVRPTPKPAAQGGLTAKELKREQRQEQHAKRLAKTVNVEDALLVLERDRRFRQSKAAMRWATWREARLLQGWPK